MILKVVNLAGAVTYIELGELPEERQNLHAVKCKIQALTGIPVLKQRLLLGNTILAFDFPVLELKDEEISMVLQDYGLSSEDVFEGASQGDIEGVMRKLHNSPQDPNTKHLGPYCIHVLCCL